MNYQRHYDALIERARDRVIDGYTERHHVVPRCLGGSNAASNLVALTPEEHYVAHQLLANIHAGNPKLIFAALAMCRGNNRSNKLYGWVRRRFSVAMSAMPRSKEHMDACHAGRRAKGTTAEHRDKLAAALTGRPKTDAHKAAMSEARSSMEYTPELREKLAANRGKPMNDRQREALLAATKGKKLTAEHIEKLCVPRGPQKDVECPHCTKTGGISLMKRWHFDNCKVAVHG